MEDSGIMELPDPSNGSTSLNDAMYRRLKNRERQRRYRERKRLRVDSRKVCVTNQSPQLQITLAPTDVTVEQFINRVYCKRDWKKDARRVHAAKQEAISEGIPSSCQPVPDENQMLHIPSSRREPEQTLKSEVPSACMLNSQKVGGKPGRRDWKAEARNKRK